MSRWGKPTKNSRRRDPRYFLNESVELEEGKGPTDHPFFKSKEEGGYDPVARDKKRGGPPKEDEGKDKLKEEADQGMPEAFMDQEGDAMGQKFWKAAMQDRYKRYLQGDDTFDAEEKAKFGISEAAQQIDELGIGRALKGVGGQLKAKAFDKIKGTGNLAQTTHAQKQIDALVQDLAKKGYGGPQGAATLAKHLKKLAAQVEKSAGGDSIEDKF